MIVYLLKVRGRGFYSETPEEQGLADGPKLIRAFAWPPEAENYKDATNAYAGVALQVTKIEEKELAAVVAKTMPNTRVELSRMRTFNNWPTTARVILDVK